MVEASQAGESGQELPTRAERAAIRVEIDASCVAQAEQLLHGLRDRVLSAMRDGQRCVQINIPTTTPDIAQRVADIILRKLEQYPDYSATVLLETYGATSYPLRWSRRISKQRRVIGVAITWT